MVSPVNGGGMTSSGSLKSTASSSSATSSGNLARMRWISSSGSGSPTVTDSGTKSAGCATPSLKEIVKPGSSSSSPVESVEVPWASPESPEESPIGIGCCVPSSPVTTLGMEQAIIATRMKLKATIFLYQQLDLLGIAIIGALRGICPPNPPMLGGNRLFTPPGVGGSGGY